MPEGERGTVVNGYTLTTSYRIYTIDENGLMKQPKKDYYGGTINRFDDFDTIEEAQQAFVAQEFYGECVILPITRHVYRWEL